MASGDAGVVLDDQLDLAAGDGVAVLRHVELDRGLDLPAGGGRLAGHRQDQADLEGLAGLRQGAQGRAGDAGCEDEGEGGKATTLQGDLR